VDLGFGDGWSLDQEIEVATFIGLGYVPCEYRPVTATVRFRGWSPRGAATGQFSLVYFDLQAPIRDVELDLVSVSYES
jgi:hypothetical protein